MVDGGELRVINGGGKYVDGDQQATEISKTWSSTTCASRGDGKARLEMTAASVNVGVLEMLQQRAR
jgi:hypothetical protein